MFVKIHPVGAELFHEDGRTDRHIMKLLIAFQFFAHSPQIILETAILQPLET